MRGAGWRETVAILLVGLWVAAGTARAGATMEDACVKIASEIAAKLNGLTTKCSIAVTEVDIGGTSTDLGKLVSSTLSDELVKKGKTYRVVDRAYLDRLMAEHKFGMSGLADPETIKKMGKLLGAAYIIVGQITPAGGKMRFAVRAIDVETGEVVVPGREFISDLSTIKELIPTGFKLDAPPPPAPTPSGETRLPVHSLERGTGTLRIESDPAGARVQGLPSGRQVGVTPLRLSNVSAGAWRYRVSSPGQGNRIITGVLKAGEERTISVALATPSSPYAGTGAPGAEPLAVEEQPFLAFPDAPPAPDAPPVRNTSAFTPSYNSTPQYRQSREIVRSVQYAPAPATVYRPPTVSTPSYYSRTPTQTGANTRSLTDRNTLRALLGGVVVANELLNKKKSRSVVRGAAIGVLGLNEAIRR